MILVTPGFEEGVGLEVFLKAVIELPVNYLSKFHLFVKKSCLDEVIKSSHLAIETKEDHLLVNRTSLKVSYLQSSELSQTTQGLEEALKIITPSDILLTLPTKKDQLVINGKVKAGYTEYLREKFSDANLTMNFI